jgi:hypothetical protein
MQVIALVSGSRFASVWRASFVPHVAHVAGYRSRI